MANVDRPSGFKPVRHLNGSPYNGQFQYFLIPSGDSVACFVGDVVKGGGTSGAAGVVVAGMDCEGMPTCARDTSATTGQAIVGVVRGFLPDPTDLTKKHRVASTNRVAMVITDPTVVYEAQEDADTTPIAQASVGLNAAIATTAGNATTGISGMEIDSNTVETTATLPLKIIGLVKRPDNALNTGGAGTDNAKFEVVFNTGMYAPNVLGV